MQSSNMAAFRLGVAIAGALAAAQAGAFDIESNDWKFSVAGNINVHYIYSSCESPDKAVPVTTVGGACTGTGGAVGSSVSNVGNGLLPAAITFGISTTQDGYDIAAHFGLYPGIASNDGGSPNLQSTTPNTNVGLATTGLDVRQVYMTFGTKDIGTFTLGRNFGLFAFDAIINDMTLPGVGVAGSASTASPSNTTLGSIGFGYLYPDTLAQIDYTTPDFAGFNFTIGIFDPLNSLTAAGTNAPKKAPGLQAKATYTYKMSDDMKFYASVAGLTQKQDYTGVAAVLGGTEQFTSSAGDIFVKFDVAGFEVDASYYHGKGLGTTGLFFLADDGFGNARTSSGYLLQGTYKFGQLKLGINYGVSKLQYATYVDSLNVPTLLDSNNKVTAGAYYSLTKNLTLLGEVSDVWTKAHDGGENKSVNGNIGAFLSF
jgi:predicted porin